MNVLTTERYSEFGFSLCHGVRATNQSIYFLSDSIFFNLKDTVYAKIVY